MSENVIAEIAAIKSMVLEVLQAHPAGMMLVALRDAVDAELVARHILPQGCRHDQVRYALRWLVGHGFVGVHLAEKRHGNHYTYCYIKGGDLLRSDVLRKRADQATPIPTTRLSPMAFACHALAQIPTTWNPSQDSTENKND